MNDIVRARLVDALQERGYFSATDRKSAAEGIVDLLLTLPGIAITELPEADDQWRGAHIWLNGDVRATPSGVHCSPEGRLVPSEARKFAAALLAAANAADE